MQDDARSKELPPLPTQQTVWLHKASYVNLWQATEISTPDGSPPRSYVDLPQMVQNTNNTGWLGEEKSYWMKGCQVPPKATSVKIGAPIVWAPQLSESDSPQVQNPLSTNNNKGGSVLNPPKPTINLVPKKDIPGGDATTSWDSKDYQ